MKKLITGAMLCVASSSVLAVDATPFFSVYAGVGSWSADYEGDIGDASADLDADLEDLGYDDEDNTYLYIAFEHAVPFIPQVRLETIDISTSATGTLNQQFQFGDETFDQDVPIASDLDLNFLDATLYYELAIFDFGLTLRQFDAEVSATGESGGVTVTDSEEVDGVLPMAYLQTKIDFPLTGLYATGSVNIISFDDKSVTDYRAALGYGIKIGPLAEIGLEAGLRSFEIDLGDEEDFAGEIELSGVYFGANVKF